MLKDTFVSVTGAAIFIRELLFFIRVKFLFLIEILWGNNNPSLDKKSARIENIVERSSPSISPITAIVDRVVMLLGGLFFMVAKNI